QYREKRMTQELDAQSFIDDEDKRAEALQKIQGQLADELPTLPLLQGSQIAISGNDVKGVDDTRDPAFQFRLALLSKSALARGAGEPTGPPAPRGAVACE